MGVLSALRPAAPDRRAIVSVQVLRFAAAAIVLFAHLEDRLGGFGDRYGFVYRKVGFAGVFGVEIFFVISGFIMLHIGWGKFGAPGAVGDFFRHRVARIVPLYWTLTALQIALALVLRDAPDRVNPANILKSLLFIPYLSEMGKHRPVLEQGWTLNFEMLFYLLFAACLVAPRRFGIAALGAVLALGGMARYFGVHAILLDPLLLLFLAGGALALVRRRLPRLLNFPYALPAAFVLIVVATTVVHDPLAHALFAILVVGLAVLCRDVAADLPGMRWLVAGGDSSYSLYLSHGFVLLVVGTAWRKLFGADLLPVYAAAVVVGSLALAWICFVFIERPLSRWTGARLARRGPQARKPAPPPSAEWRREAPGASRPGRTGALPHDEVGVGEGEA
ncbi:acyltransferase [Phenylobacterium sp.]|uniref:acyltransferase family protein n=1 Tax=Phenylobacterium sp. TaxID=1871053 RepID=UPI002F40A7A5